jgi:hypothetical protein
MNSINNYLIIFKIINIKILILNKQENKITINYIELN